MTETSPRLSLPYIQPAQAQKHVTHNEAVERLDAVTQMQASGIDALIPPPLPTDGETHALGAAPTGDWAGQGGKIAYWTGSGWIFITPQTGWRLWDSSAGMLRVWNGTQWQLLTVALQNLPGVGIATTSDPVNRLSVAADATLLSHAGSGHQLKLNKAGVGDTASLLLQSGFSGRAEIGLAGSDALSVKVSPDGILWTQVLSADPVAQTLSLAPAGTERLRISDSGVEIAALVSGSAVQADPQDTTNGRLLRMTAAGGPFGLGATQPPTCTGLDATTLPTGWYNTINTTTGTFPGGANTFGTLFVERYNAAEYLQRYVSILTDMVWQRRLRAGVWQPWVRLSNEYGGNANGDFVRFPDGTMICTRASLSAATTNTADGALFKSPNVTWTLPATFIAAPLLQGSFANSADAFVTPLAATTTTATLRLRSTVTKATATTFGVSAIGRWF